ncbi:MAG: hypothetical protein WCS42_21315, partial [Verrucomicrobiota bacterium]
MIKATVRRPAGPSVVTAAQTAARSGNLNPAPVIDVESSVVDNDSATALADQLEAGTAVIEDGTVVEQPLVPLLHLPVTSARAWSGGGFEGDDYVVSVERPGE